MLNVCFVPLDTKRINERKREKENSADREMRSIFDDASRWSIEKEREREGERECDRFSWRSDSQSRTWFRRPPSHLRNASMRIRRPCSDGSHWRGKRAFNADRNDRLPVKLWFLAAWLHSHPSSLSPSDIFNSSLFVLFQYNPCVSLYTWSLASLCICEYRKRTRSGKQDEMKVLIFRHDNFIDN